MFLGLYIAQIMAPMWCKIVMVLYIRFVRCHRDDSLTIHMHISFTCCVPASRKSTLYMNINQSIIYLYQTTRVHRRQHTRTGTHSQTLRQWCRPIYTVFQKSDAKIQITITTAHLIRINYPLNTFNYRLSGTNIATFKKKSTTWFLSNSFLQNGT